jgi:hypothetical protein
MEIQVGMLSHDRQKKFRPKSCVVHTMRISSFSVPALESRVTPGNGGIAKFWDSSWLQGRASRDLAPNLYSWLGGKTRKSGMICITKTGLSTMSTADEMAEFVMLWSLVQEVVLFFFFLTTKTRSGPQ